ncbi:MAG: hypothetical protein K0S65_4400 [Labilithrix sp.]|nr:hypothetical protein [Labilithrix sp.]
MLRAKATRVRRKLRVARGRWGAKPSCHDGNDARSAVRNGSTRSASADMITPNALGKQLSDVALTIVSACSGAAVGFDLCAQRTKDETIAVAARSAAVFLRALVDATVEAAWFHGLDVRPRTRMGDRLRWEWLASTATVVDGGAESRLFSECARMLASVDPTDATPLGDELTARFRVATAEAFSLASAAEQTRRRQLALALT